MTKNKYTISLDDGKDISILEQQLGPILNELRKEGYICIRVDGDDTKSRVCHVSEIKEIAKK
jgi:hypothetical protein